MLKYKCLVLDHDDTVVKTTAEIHYPSFKQTISEVKPWVSVTEKEFLLKCFNPGFFDYMEKELEFTQAEMAYQLESWLKYVDDKIPNAYDGMKEIIHRQKAEGGLVCVVSHSYSKIIRRDYDARIGMQPDMIFGGEEPEDKRKPSVYPLEQIAAAYGLQPKDMVMVDDLKPALDMCKSFGVDFICAGWSHGIDEIIEYMKAESPVYLTKTRDLADYLFEK